MPARYPGSGDPGWDSRPARCPGQAAAFRTRYRMAVPGTAMPRAQQRSGCAEKGLPCAGFGMIPALSGRSPGHVNHCGGSMERAKLALTLIAAAVAAGIAGCGEEKKPA